MRINSDLAKTACPSGSGTLLPDHCSGLFVNRIERAGLLAVALAAIVVLATGCSSTGTGFFERLHVFEVADGTPTNGLRTHLQQCEKVGRWRGTTDVGTKGTLALYCERWSVC
jgi:hypothetical protein